jgi:hypothetical protein
VMIQFLGCPYVLILLGFQFAAGGLDVFQGLEVEAAGQVRVRELQAWEEVAGGLMGWAEEVAAWRFCEGLQRHAAAVVALYEGQGVCGEL